MPSYRSFIHVERLEQIGADYLNGVCYVSPKLDGTNAVMWWDESTNTIKAGSRNRELTAEKDNAGFHAWATSSNNPFKVFFEKYPTLILYGEWGLGKVGSIKDYDEEAKNNFWVFDAWLPVASKYVHPENLELFMQECGLGQFFVPFTRVIDPTMEQLAEIVDNNQFLLKNSNHKGEGIVVRNPDYRDEYGHYRIAKIVSSEYQEKKQKSKKPIVDQADIEKSIIECYVTEAELSKAVAKTCAFFNLDSFLLEGKYVGYYLNTVFQGAIVEEMASIIKRYKHPTIDFKVLQSLVNAKAREFIKL